MAPSLRAAKSEQVRFSLQNVDTYESDQLAILKGITERASQRNEGSPSLAMAEIYIIDTWILQAPSLLKMQGIKRAAVDSTASA